MPNYRSIFLEGPSTEAEANAYEPSREDLLARLAVAFDGRSSQELEWFLKHQVNLFKLHDGIHRTGQVLAAGLPGLVDRPVDLNQDQDQDQDQDLRAQFTNPMLGDPVTARQNLQEVGRTEAIRYEWNPVLGSGSWVPSDRPPAADVPSDFELAVPGSSLRMQLADAGIVSGQTLSHGTITAEHGAIAAEHAAGRANARLAAADHDVSLMQAALLNSLGVPRRVIDGDVEPILAGAAEVESIGERTGLSSQPRLTHPEPGVIRFENCTFQGSTPDMIAYSATIHAAGGGGQLSGGNAQVGSGGSAGNDGGRAGFVGLSVRADVDAVGFMPPANVYAAGGGGGAYSSASGGGGGIEGGGSRSGGVDSYGVSPLAGTLGRQSVADAIRAMANVIPSGRGGSTTQQATTTTMVRPDNRDPVDNRGRVDNIEPPPLYIVIDAGPVLSGTYTMRQNWLSYPENYVNILINTGGFGVTLIPVHPPDGPESGRVYATICVQGSGSYYRLSWLAVANVYCLHRSESPLTAEMHALALESLSELVSAQQQQRADRVHMQDEIHRIEARGDDILRDILMTDVPALRDLPESDELWGYLP